MKRKLTFSSDYTEMNFILIDHDDLIHTDEVPMECLLLITGVLNGKLDQFLKDDGFNTELVSYYFVQDRHAFFKITRNSVMFSQSRK